MSTLIYQSDDFAISGCASNCDRCGRRGRCVQFITFRPGAVDSDDSITHTLCMATCWPLVVKFVDSDQEVPPA